MYMSLSLFLSIYLSLSLYVYIYIYRFCAMLDAVAAHCLSKRAKGDALPHNQLDQYVCVIDAEGASRKNFSLPAMKMMQRMATTRYAERVAKMCPREGGQMAACVCARMRACT